MTQAEREQHIRAYLRGQDSPQGRALFDAWADQLATDSDFLDTLTPAELERLETALWAGIQACIATPETPPAQRQPAAAGKLRPLFPYGLAASLVLLLGIGYGYWTGFRLQPSSAPLTEETRWCRVRVGTGRRHTVVLPDGSRVVVNAGSSLRYPLRFSGTDRPVLLTGEAFFEVVPDPSRPFQVRTRDLTTTVRGTSFLVEAYPDETEARVSVLTGRVEVAPTRGSQPTLTLTPGDRAVWAQEALRAERGTETDQLLAWQQGMLVFDRTPLPLVARRLGRHYSVQIRLASPRLAACTWVGRFDDVPLQDVLRALEVSLGVSYQQTGKEVVLQGEGCR